MVRENLEGKAKMIAQFYEKILKPIIVLLGIILIIYQFASGIDAWMALFEVGK